MTSPTSRDGKENELLKVDTKGRVQIPPERRKDLLEEFDRSGMTGAAFAKHCGINHDKALLFGNKTQQSVNLSGEVKLRWTQSLNHLAVEIRGNGLERICCYLG